MIMTHKNENDTQINIITVKTFSGIVRKGSALVENGKFQGGDSWASLNRDSIPIE